MFIYTPSYNQTIGLSPNLGYELAREENDEFKRSLTFLISPM